MALPTAGTARLTSYRPADQFEGSVQDRTAWFRGLLVGALFVPVLLGYGSLLGYYYVVYYVVIRSNQPGSPC